VIAVRHGFVTATGAVNVIGRMTAAVVAGRAGIGICRADRDRMFVYMITMRMMQVAIMQVVCVAVVFDGRVPATRTMLMIVVRVNVAGFVRRILGHRMLLKNWRIES